MLRYLSPKPGKPSTSRGSSTSRDPKTSRDVKAGASPTLYIHVVNFGIIFLEPPEREGRHPAQGQSDPEPRDDVMLHGELEVRVPSGPLRCKAVRVGLRTTINLDMGQGRKGEEDILFERKVEIIGATSDGIYLAQGNQRFDFTIIIPSNLAPHDWHTNGKIIHDLYAELEGLPEPEFMRTSSSTSLFTMRKGKKSPSAHGSRSSSPAPRGRPLSTNPSMPGSGASTPLGSGHGTPAPPQALAGALASLNLNAAGLAVPSATAGAAGATSPIVGSGSGNPSPPGASSPGGTNPAHLVAEYSLSTTRQEVPFLPPTPAYDELPGAQPAEVPWIHGTLRAKRNVMLVYNPSLSGGSNELDETANGYVPGLGVWDLNMVSDVWTICALLRIKFDLTSLMDTTTVFAIRLALAQTTTVFSPRTEEQATFTRHFALMERGKRPPVGHHHPDKHYPAVWRGKAAGGKDVTEGDGGEIHIDTTARLPDDTVGRPSTLPGVVTPIRVTHNINLEVFFSVFGEDDRGQKMKIPGPGGLRMLRISRPVILPSCICVPAVVDLPSYEDHARDKIAEASVEADMTTPGWELCACGHKLETMEARMKAAASKERSQLSVAQMASGYAAEAKGEVERERGRTGRNGSV